MPAEVLVIEDSRTQALRVRLALEQAGLAVSLATTGLEGVDVCLLYTSDAADE